jgi:acetyl-CoA acetyltransferase
MITFNTARRSSMTNVYIGNEKLTPIGQLNGTLSGLSAVELGSVMISDLINDIDP